MCTTKRKSRSPPASEKPSQESNEIAKSSGTTDHEEGWTWKNFWEAGIVWRNVILMAYIHSVGMYGLYVWFSGQLRWQTIVCGKFPVYQIFKTCLVLIYNDF